jgi:hypothetical protein
MDIVYRLQGIEFEWDTNKAQSNLEKHNLRFEEAAEVFLDPQHSGVSVSWVRRSLQ